MSEGPLGGPRPLAKTRLKYEVDLIVERSVYNDPDVKASDVSPMRVNSPQAPYSRFIKRKIGDVILAVNRLTSPNRAKVIDEELLNERQAVSNISGTEQVVRLVYAIDGTGIGEASETSTTTDSVVKLHKVLRQGNSTPIQNAVAIRSFNPSPGEINRVTITTD